MGPNHPFCLIDIYLSQWSEVQILLISSLLFFLLKAFEQRYTGIFAQHARQFRKGLRRSGNRDIEKTALSTENPSVTSKVTFRHEQWYRSRKSNNALRVHRKTWDQDLRRNRLQKAAMIGDTIERNKQLQVVTPTKRLYFAFVTGTHQHHSFNLHLWHMITTTQESVMIYQNGYEYCNGRRWDGMGNRIKLLNNLKQIKQ